MSATLFLCLEYNSNVFSKLPRIGRRLQFKGQSSNARAKLDGHKQSRCLTHLSPPGQVAGSFLAIPCETVTYLANSLADRRRNLFQLFSIFHEGLSVHFSLSACRAFRGKYSTIYHSYALLAHTSEAFSYAKDREREMSRPNYMLFPVPCDDCHARHKIQMNFEADLPLFQNAQAYPEDGMLECSHCRKITDLAKLKSIVETDMRREIIT